MKALLCVLALSYFSLFAHNVVAIPVPVDWVTLKSRKGHASSVNMVANSGPGNTNLFRTPAVPGFGQKTKGILDFFPVDRVDWPALLHSLIDKVLSACVFIVQWHIVLNMFQNVYKLSISDATPLGLPDDIRALLKPNVTLNSEEIEIASHIVLPTHITEDWEDIGGMTNMKSAMLEMAEFNSTSSRYSVRGSKSVLLFGPPGCGKSLLIHALARKLDFFLLKVTPSTLYRKYLGDSNQLLKAVFTLIGKLQGGVVMCVDEVDALLGRRTDDDFRTNVAERQIKTECKCSAIFYMLYLRDEEV
ncbi:ATP-binding protein [archaeon]|nr:MAG: ATP-binding protein [archaeon]